jgi:hypothetical protein
MLIKLYKKLKRKWYLFIKRKTCKHTHIFKHDLPNEYWYSLQENGKYKRMGQIHGLQIKGCYVCGKVWAVNWAK